ncbi:tRNA glutamyl-Q(34) synthetase GluQRS [Neiella marina]|uniref:Glutamyl-Q tRNA(Asp) synthetase n=1 Tax=Neiella holothuriorum TaxID=2870530 RepID=A0ABS7EB00_9GAMM|nr:tRNA glutamyl-Q(34) synthetase GluQRS [Neiella holothuriorum]MBW8189514.1 tRNA glutamyl-Q(34) synthetase GluQRS [Neiella holothuriorum]
MLESEQTPRQTLYRGRFAPSPSGPLHFGSLIAAVGSYLDARAHNGQWLVRIEDIDPPREVAGADSEILRALEAFGLYWDESVRYQSSHLNEFQAVIDTLLAEQRAYFCNCPRKRIKAIGGLYDGHCRDRLLDGEHCAVRYRNDVSIRGFNDLRLGWQDAAEAQDFVIKRRDGLMAYQLAVVLDDIDQQLNHIVRGVDLLDTTVSQLALYSEFNQSPPSYLHLPLALDGNGNKLSKQNHAPAVNWQQPQVELWQALQCLNLNPPTELKHQPVAQQLEWSTNNWQRHKLGQSNHIKSVC